MSGLACAIALDGRPIAAGLAQRMLASIVYRGSEVRTVALGPHVLLGWRGTSEGQAGGVYRDVAAGLTLAWDGWLDNHQELQDRFGEPDFPSLLFHAYAKWGEEFPDRLLGDFAFVLWDARRRVVLAARDTAGARPLVYWCDHQLLLCASEPVQILRSGVPSRSPDLGHIAELLAGVISNNEETLFCGVRRLPPGHLLLVQSGQRVCRRYWRPEALTALKLGADAQYAEAFRSILCQATQTRLERVLKPGAYLSGGLDSSSIVAIANGLQSGLTAYSAVFPGRPCDETTFINAVTRHTGRPAIQIEPSPQPFRYYEEQIERYQDTPEYPNASLLDPLRQAARQAGVTLLLAGYGGDDWLSGSPWHFADLLSRGRLHHAWQLAQATGSNPWRVLRPYVRHALPRGLAQRVLPRRPLAIGCPWIHPTLARAVCLKDRLREAQRPSPLFAEKAKGALFAGHAYGWSVRALELEERSAAWHGLCQRYPFHDRRVVEFALSVPEEQLQRGGGSKYVLRQAMRPYLPAEVIDRKDKAEFSSVVQSAFRRVPDPLCEPLTLFEREWLDCEQYRRSLEAADLLTQWNWLTISRWATLCLQPGPPMFQ